MSQEWIHTVVFLAGVAGASMFVLGLHRMNSPATGRSGNQLSAVGMTVAVLSTLVGLVTSPGGLSGTAWIIILVGFAIGGGLGLYAARTVKMTAMPQLVSMFNAVGGGAAALVAIDDFIGLNSSGSVAPIDDQMGTEMGTEMNQALRGFANDLVRETLARVEAIDQLLDIRQQAKFRVFEEQMERRKLELVMRARQGKQPRPKL